MLLLLAGCSAFVAAGVFLLRFEPPTGWSGLAAEPVSRTSVAWAAIVFFGLGIPVAIVNLLPGGSYLELDQRGFTMCNLFRKTFHRWEDVAEFFPISLDGVKPMVALRYAPSYQEHAAGRRLATKLAGAEGGLPDTYGLSAAELARLLNKVRAEQSVRF